MLHIKLSHTVRPNFSIVLQDKDDPNTQYKNSMGWWANGQVISYTVM